MLKKTILCACLCLGANVYAQELSPSMQQNQSTSGAIERWQSGVEAIRGQMATLINQNDKLTQNYEQAKAQEEKLINMIMEQRKKNDALSQFLKERGPKTDQQLRIDKLNDQLSVKRLQFNKLMLDYKTLHDKVAVIQQRIDDKKLKVSEYELHQGQPQPAVKKEEPKEDLEIVALTKELEKQRKAEEELEDQINPNNTDGNSNEIQRLKDKLTALQSQKAALMGKSTPVAAVDRGKYFMMQSKKQELESKLRTFEKRIDSLKAASVEIGSWAQGRKEMVKAIIEGDNRNKRLAKEIKETKENIALLRSQIGVLEKRVLFSNK